MKNIGEVTTMQNPQKTLEARIENLVQQLKIEYNPKLQSQLQVYSQQYKKLTGKYYSNYRQIEKQ